MLHRTRTDIQRRRQPAYGNLFAAMPSLHVGLVHVVRAPPWPLALNVWAKALLVLYPVTIFFCIVVTANHWNLDAVGGGSCSASATCSHVC